MAYGCCGLGDAPLKQNFAWGYLSGMGQDDYMPIIDTGSDIMGPTLEEAAGGPVDTITAGDLATYVDTGSADPSVLSQIANIVKVAGPTVQGIMQQIQFGQLAANTPVSQLAQLRTAVMGTPASSIIASLTANPIVLVGGLALLFLVLKRR